MDIRRTIGRLEEHQKSTNHRLELIEKKIDKILEFKWKIVGVMVFVSTVISIVLEAAKTLGASFFP